MTRAIRIKSTVASLVVAAVVVSCTDAYIEPTRTEATQVDSRLELNGRVCTSPPDPNGFPVKVVLVVDQSGSMCVSDPPGSQGGQGFCEQTHIRELVPEGVTQPARIRALNKLLDQFSAQPNVQVAILPFATNVPSPWPAEGFARPNAQTASFVADLQSGLGKGTDYQGALAKAYERIRVDIEDTALNAPELLPRSRYVVVFLSDGTPYPRCSANDSLTQFASAADPSGIWADTFGAEEFCNLLDDPNPGPDSPSSEDWVDDWEAGSDRNQNHQLFTYVDNLMQLKEANSVGDIRLHTVLLFNEAAVARCGDACNVLFGEYTAAEAKQIAGWTLKQLADRGNGIYQAFTDSDIGQMSLGALDYSSLASPFVMKTLAVENATSAPGVDGPVLDSDGDGLPDTEDNSFTSGTNRFFADTDEDCFSDGFETLRSAEGFVADNQKDSRGCDPDSPLTPECECVDTDGDGLSQYAERFVESKAKLVDSDGDGIPDGVEARYGLDPTLRAAADIDTDGDGVPDLDEIRGGSNPTRQDRAYFQRFGAQYEVRAEEQPDGRVCYDFTVNNLQLVTPPNSGDADAGTSESSRQQGHNLFKVYFAEAPASGIGTDYGRWRVACAWAQYDPPSVRVPAGPDLTLIDDNFKLPPELSRPEDFLGDNCVGIAP